MAEAAAPPPFDADAYVEQASRLVGIEVAAAFRPGVAANIAPDRADGGPGHGPTPCQPRTSRRRCSCRPRPAR